MIQRIQSMYLLIIVLVLAVIYFLPMAAFTTTISTETVLWKLSGFSDPDVFAGQKLPPMNITAIFALALGLASVMTLLFYKNRAFQIRMSRNMLIVSILFVASIFFLVDKSSNLEGVVMYAYLSGTYLSLIVPVMAYLTIGAIRRDERKVRAADRLR
jgi:hypothetical protein